MLELIAYADAKTAPFFAYASFATTLLCFLVFAPPPPHRSSIPSSTATSAGEEMKRELISARTSRWRSVKYSHTLLPALQPFPSKNQLWLSPDRAAQTENISAYHVRVYNVPLGLVLCHNAV